MKLEHYMVVSELSIESDTAQRLFADSNADYFPDISEQERYKVMQWKIFPDTNDISLILKVKFFNMESPANNRANN